MLFVANSQSHYFSVSPTVQLDIELLKTQGCTICATLQDLYTHVMETLSLEIDEVEGTELLITSSNNETKCIDDRGSSEVITGDVNAFISEYTL